VANAELVPSPSPPLDWTYAPSRESTDIVSLNERYGLFIDGKFRAPLSGKYFPTINPATEEPLAEVAEAGEKDVDRAVKAARAAYDDSWGSMAGKERAKYLFRIARMIQERSRELAVLETMDCG
jgi:aldehyde dehydrogenase (NAD+)